MSKIPRVDDAVTEREAPETAEEAKIRKKNDCCVEALIWNCFVVATVPVPLLDQDSFCPIMPTHAFHRTGCSEASDQLKHHCLSTSFPSASEEADDKKQRAAEKKVARQKEAAEKKAQKDAAAAAKLAAMSPEEKAKAG